MYGMNVKWTRNDIYVRVGKLESSETRPDLSLNAAGSASFPAPNDMIKDGETHYRGDALDSDAKLDNYGVGLSCLSYDITAPRQQRAHPSGTVKHSESRDSNRSISPSLFTFSGCH